MKTKPDQLKILAFFAHPDDETMFLGGTLACLADQKVQIEYLCATRGEGGERGDPPLCTQEALGEVREQELTCAVQVLGGNSLRFLDYHDPLVGPNGELYPYTDHNEEFVEKILRVIEEILPDVVLTHGPGGEYGHPGHILTHRALMDAVNLLAESKPAVYAPCWLSRETGEFVPPPDHLLNIEPFREQKVAAALCHRSQHALFRRHGAQRAGRPVTVPELIRTKEGLILIDAGKWSSPADPLAPFLGPVLIS